MTPLERAIANAGIVSGITFFSTLSISYPPSMANVWAATIGAMLALLTTLKVIFEKDDNNNNEGCKKPPSLGMLI